MLVIFDPMGFSAPEFDECDIVDQLASASGKPSTNPLVECKTMRNSAGLGRTRRMPRRGMCCFEG